MGGDNFFIQRPCRIMSGNGSSERKAHESGVASLPMIDSDQILWHKVIGGFFKNFTSHRLKEGFPFFKMACRLVVTDPIADFFFNQQIVASLFDDGGYRHMGFPDLSHTVKCIRAKLVFYRQVGPFFG